MYEISLLLTENRIYQGSLILVNQKYPVRYHLSQEELCPVFSGQPEILMEQESAGMLKKLLLEVQGNPGIHCSQPQIVGVSGYRTKAEQIQIFEDSMEENGREFTEKFVAFPEHSEHQTGLAMDLAKNQPEIDFICPEFPYDGICQRFREKAAEFGFVERYTEKKQKITGIGAEPWHFRYVGAPHAELMQKGGMALEEYIEWLKQFDLAKSPLVFRKRELEYRIGYIKSQGKVTECKIPKARARISGNNADGFIITIITLWDSHAALQTAGWARWEFRMEEA